MHFAKRFDLAGLVSRHHVTHLIASDGASEVSGIDGIVVHLVAASHAAVFNDERIDTLHADGPAFLASERVSAVLSDKRCVVSLDAWSPGANLSAELESLQDRAQHALIAIAGASSQGDASLVRFESTHSLQRYANDPGFTVLWSRAWGDAQYLANVPTGCFDFVYSSHCLEHMVDPRIALRYWLRVLKLGGHLVVTVPDEDMYEQGAWPSTFNDDHKHTFAMFKRTSWLPVSINVLDLLREFEQEVEIARVERLDHSFLPHMPRFDQTRTAFAECGIEFVLRKI